MNDLDDYIESYFKEQLNDAEKKQFEERCAQDEVFAKEVAFYITLRETLRQELLEQKKQLWANEEQDKESNEEQGKESNITTPVKRMMLYKWLPYIAAACLLFLVGLYFLNESETPQQFANKYIKEHFTLLSHTMSASDDSLQQAIAAYNNKDYSTALQRFEKISRSHPPDGEAKRYMGLVYLLTNDYDKALQQFDELGEMKGLYNNAGPFLKAITLLKRDTDGDKANAKRLLELVVKEGTEGSRDARVWLKNW